MKEKRKRIVAISIIFLVSLFMELIVFHANCFRLWGGEYPYKKVVIEEKDLVGLQKVGENTYEATQNNPYINIDSLNIVTGTIRVNACQEDFEESMYKRNLPVIIYYTDATSAYFRSVPTKEINSYVQRTQYATLHLSGETNDLKLKFLVEKGTRLNIQDIEINASVPYEINWIRMSIVFVSMLAIYLLFHLPCFEKPYSRKDSNQGTIVFAIGVFFCLILFFFMLASTGGEIGLVSKLDEIGKVVYEQYYPDAILQGKLSLDVEPSQELLTMENPYDDSVRTTEQVPQLFDYTYYQGKYYVYFSILPELLLFVPFHVLTGQYLNIAWAVFIFAILGSVYLILLIKGLFEKYFKDCKFRTMVLAIVIALFSSLILYAMGRPRVYEVVATCGFWLVMQGMYFLWKAFQKEGKISFAPLTICCISLALAVNARPNLILVSLLVAPIFISKLIKLIKERKQLQITAIEKQNKTKTVLKYICAIGIPYLIIGVAIMTLNYVRFGSIIEFGAAYQLTSNDMQALGYRFSTIPLGIWHYLFNPAKIDLVFPFIHTIPNSPLYLGFYGQGYAGIGTLIACPICLFFLVLPTIKNKIKEKDSGLWKGIRNSIGVAILMVIVITLLAASYQRYALDYAWMLIIPAIIVTMTIYELAKNNEILQKIFEILLTGIAIFCIIENLAIAITSEWDSTQKLSTQLYDQMKYSTMFWE